MIGARLAAAGLVVALAGCGSAAPAATGSGERTPTRAGRGGPTTTAPASGPAPGLRTEVAARLPAPLSREVVLADGAGLLLAGGLDAGGSSSTAVDRLDPRTGRVTPAGRLARPVHDAAGARLGGSTYVFGGGAATTVATVQGLRPGATAVTVGSLPRPRSDLVAATIGSTGYVLGGYDGSTELADVLATTDGHRFRTVARLPVTVRYPAVAVSGHRLLVVGGEHAGAPTDTVQAVDVDTGRAQVLGHLPAPLAHAAAGVLGGTVVVAGGRLRGRVTGQVFTLDPATGAVRAVGHLPQPEADAGATVLDGALWLVGGEDTGRLSTVQRVSVSG